MLKVKGGYRKLYPILAFIGSSTRNNMKKSSVGLELASTFYVFSVDSDTRNYGEAMYDLTVSIDSCATETICGARDRKKEQIGANVLLHGDMRVGFILQVLSLEPL